MKMHLCIRPDHVDLRVEMNLTIVMFVMDLVRRFWS